MQKPARSKGVMDGWKAHLLRACFGNKKAHLLRACFGNKIMLDDYGFEIYENNDFPLAYLITIRTFGTWLHGDERHSVDRHGKNIYGTLDVIPNLKLNETMKNELKQPAIILDESQREVVEIAVRELCEQRKYHLQAINVRSNHAHFVVSALMKPERIADAFKAFVTKKLREENLFSRELQIWSRGRSRRYLWKPRSVELAIDYVLYCQGDVSFEVFAETRTK